MTPYGITHLVPLAVFLVGVVVVVALGRRHRHLPQPTPFSRGWAVLIPAVTVPLQVYDFLFDFDVDVTLPLQLCDLAWMAAAWALWSHRPFPVALTFFWGLTLTSQAIVTPTLGSDFPDFRYLSFWALHLLVVWAAVYLAIGLRLAPRWEDYRATVLATAVWAVTVYAFNVVADTNYGYLMRKPSGGSVLDLLGPWPWYVVAEVVLIAAVWAALTALCLPVRDPSCGSRRRRAGSLPS